jgi:hypothetical protein
MNRRILLASLLVLALSLLAALSSVLVWAPQAVAEEVLAVETSAIDPGVLQLGVSGGGPRHGSGGFGRRHSPWPRWVRRPSAPWRRSPSCSAGW